MAIHFRRDGSLSICGYSGYGSQNTEDIDKVTCKRCRYIIENKYSLELRMRFEKLEAVKNI